MLLRACLAVMTAGLLLVEARSDESPDSRVDALVESLADGDESVRLSAAHELGRIGRVARKAEPQLVEALRDPDEFVRSAAADSLLRVGGESQLVLPLLDDKDVQLSVVESLLSLRQEATLVASTVIELKARRDPGLDKLLVALNPDLSSRLQMVLFESLDDANESRSEAACQCIEELGRLELSSVPALIQLLNSPRRMARLGGAKLLMRLGPVAHRAQPALGTLSNDPDLEVSLTARAALAAVAGDENALRRMGAALVSDDS